MGKTALTILAVTSTLVLGGMVRANAATVTETYDFTIAFPSGAPVSTWDGSFTITFDPTAAGFVGPSALDAFSSNLPASYGTFVFAYAAPPGNVLSIGDDCVSVGCGTRVGTDNAGFDFSHVTASGGLTFFAAAITSTTTTTTNFTTFTGTATETPLPATLPLFTTGPRRIRSARLAQEAGRRGGSGGGLKGAAI